MRIRHLNCGTMCPFAAKLVAGEGDYLETAALVCHCLLVETRHGLVLVDTGFGLDDVRHPTRRMGYGFGLVGRPLCREEETAARQIERLGYQRRDVRHIVVTHLDFDHAGGLPDFPEAQVHLYAKEHDAAMAPETMVERQRYAPRLWAHGPRWAPHEVEGDTWLGFDAVQLLDERDPEVLLVPLVGHTRGHAGVAVKTDGGYVLHAGDAYFFRDETDPIAPRCPPALALLQRAVDANHTARVKNQDRLRALRREHGEVRIFCAHDSIELRRAL